MRSWVLIVGTWPSGPSLMGQVFIASGSRCIVTIRLRTFYDDVICLSGDANDSSQAPHSLLVRYQQPNETELRRDEGFFTNNIPGPSH